MQAVEVNESMGAAEQEFPHSGKGSNIHHRFVIFFLYYNAHS